jgi:putative ABC transport system ATP-binding protein
VSADPGRSPGAGEPLDVAEALLFQDDDRPVAPSGAIAVLRRGIATSPELRRGIGVTILLALLGGAGRVVVPVLVQQVIDRGLVGGGVDLGTVYRLALAGMVAVVATAVITRTTRARLAVASEEALCGLRVRAFSHVHRLSIAHQSEEHRGALVSRVTSDVETLSIFFQWGGVAWLVNGAVMVATVVTMAVYDIRLAAVAVTVVLPLTLVLKLLQKHLIAAYDLVRTRVGELLTVVSETVQGAAAVRGYGIEDRTNARTFAAIHRWRDANIRAGVIGAFLFPAGEIFASLTVAGVIVAGVALGPDAGLTAGQVVAFIFLVNLFLEPVAEFTEILDQTQTAVAGWRKVLDLLDIPVEVVDPDPGTPLPEVAPDLVVSGLSYAYRSGGPRVLSDVSFAIPAQARVALVGATGSGKTTLAKLLTRLADPTEGHILVSGIDLREVAPTSLRRRLVMVPQDGFLFDTTVAGNVRFGRPDADDDDIRLAFLELGIEAWVEGLPAGMHTRVGQRGEHLSVGERQLVALARAYVANPTCLILDEATSSVDPATETRLTRALQSLSRGRTSITIAHRLATAEQADQILVLHHGRLVEQGRHDELVRAGGVYAGLHASWLDVTAATAATAAG